MISNYESGKTIPKADSILKLISVLQFPRSFFSADTFELYSGATFFRSRSAATKKVRDMQKERLKYVQEVYKVLATYVNFPKVCLPELIEKNVKIETIGFYEGLPQSTIDAIDFAKAKTQHNTGLTLVFAINYGGRAEIIQSMKAIYNELQLNGQGSEVIDEALIKRHLMTHSYPDPDLLIRTSGEQRISNFLIWQASYSEFIFNEKLWPDFDEKELRECLKIYQSRQRRFGGLSEE